MYVLADVLVGVLPLESVSKAVVAKFPRRVQNRRRSMLVPPCVYVSMSHNVIIQCMVSSGMLDISSLCMCTPSSSPKACLANAAAVFPPKCSCCAHWTRDTGSWCAWTVCCPQEQSQMSLNVDLRCSPAIVVTVAIRVPTAVCTLPRRWNWVQRKT